MTNINDLDYIMLSEINDPDRKQHQVLCRAGYGRVESYIEWILWIHSVPINSTVEHEKVLQIQEDYKWATARMCFALCHLIAHLNTVKVDNYCAVRSACLAHEVPGLIPSTKEKEVKFWPTTRKDLNSAKSELGYTTEGSMSDPHQLKWMWPQKMSLWHFMRSSAALQRNRVPPTVT